MVDHTSLVAAEMSNLGLLSFERVSAPQLQVHIHLSQYEYLIPASHDRVEPHTRAKNVQR